MKIYRGDVVFNNEGRPGLVTGRDTLSGKLQVETDGPNYERTRAFGFVNGLSPEDRSVFSQIVDRLRAVESPQQRVVEYGKQIDILREDPRNRHLVRYLTAEMAHLMFTEGIRPREYLADETKF